MAGVVVAICGAALVCALLSHFVTDGGTKKLISLIMGAFIVCSMMVPVKNAFDGLRVNFDAVPSEKIVTATADEACRESVLAQTKSILEQTLLDILAQEGITANRVEIILALRDETRIIISQANIYISSEQAYKSESIISLTRENFSVTPNIYTER